MAEDQPKKRKNVVQRAFNSMGRHVAGRGPAPGEDQGDPAEYLTQDEVDFIMGKKKKKNPEDKLDE